MSASLSSAAPLLVTVVEAARLLAAKPWGVIKLCEGGQLPFGHIGERRVIPAAAVHEYAASVVELHRQDSHR